MLAAAAVPILASQLRHFQHEFGAYTHARQMEFVVQGVAAANNAGVSDDGEMMAWLLNRWRLERENAA